MDPLSAFSLATSLATIALIAGIITRYTTQWLESVASAQEEMLSLVDEAQNTRHALKPIEEYARAGYVGESERQLLLGCIGRLRSLNARLNREMLRQLDNKNISFFSRATWWFRRNRLREIAANVSAQKETLIAVQVSMLAKQVIILNRKIDTYEANEEQATGSNIGRTTVETLHENADGIELGSMLDEQA